jgi:hypothetical protein
MAHDGELLFFFVLQGELGLVLRPTPTSEDHDAAIAPGGRVLREADAVAIPAGLTFELVEPSTGLELLEVALPAEPVTVQPVDERR